MKKLDEFRDFRKHRFPGFEEVRTFLELKGWIYMPTEPTFMWFHPDTEECACTLYAYLDELGASWSINDNALFDEIYRKVREKYGWDPDGKLDAND